MTISSCFISSLNVRFGAWCSDSWYQMVKSWHHALGSAHLVFLSCAVYLCLEDFIFPLCSWEVFFPRKKCDFQSLFAPAAVLNKKCLCTRECTPVMHRTVNSAEVADYTPFVQPDLMAVVQLHTSCEWSYPLRCIACDLSSWRWSSVVHWK